MPRKLPYNYVNPMGYVSYGQPLQQRYAGRLRLVTNPLGAGYGTAASAVPYGSPSASQGLAAPSYPPRNAPNMRPGAPRPENIPPAGQARYQTPGPVGAGWGVSAQTPQLGALNVPIYPAVANPGVGPGNVPNPLFGRPGFTYPSVAPSARIGPIFKGAPGTGLTGAALSNMRGQPIPGYGAGQYFPGTQFDYVPPTRSDWDAPIPKSVFVGDDGVELVGTYRAHDFTPAQRFFSQMRSSAYWQDQSFGPNYRLLLGQQQPGKYNIWNDIQLSRPLSPNAYFLGYQTQMPVAAYIGGIQGQGRPLGYGAS